jgi:hypothetical protein
MEFKVTLDEKIKVLHKTFAQINNNNNNNVGIVRLRTKATELVVNDKFL